MENVIYNPSATQGRYYRNGLCIRCGNERDSTRLQCASCREKCADQKKSSKEMRLLQGICIKCSNSSLPNSQMCQKCFFNNVANTTLKNVKMGQLIATLFEEQDGRCAYTGETLILGINTSIDHKTPQCRGGGHNIENLQWVCKRVNRNKYNLTHEEFVAECANIANKFCSITLSQVTPVEAPRL